MRCIVDACAGQGPVVAALAASFGSAALTAWERAVFDGGTGGNQRLYSAEAHEVLTADLSLLIRFLCVCSLLLPAAVDIWLDVLLNVGTLSTEPPPRIRNHQFPARVDPISYSGYQVMPL